MSDSDDGFCEMANQEWVANHSWLGETEERDDLVVVAEVFNNVYQPTSISDSQPIMAVVDANGISHTKWPKMAKNGQK